MKINIVYVWRNAANEDSLEAWMLYIYNIVDMTTWGLVAPYGQEFLFRWFRFGVKSL